MDLSRHNGLESWDLMIYYSNGLGRKLDLSRRVSQYAYAIYIYIYFIKLYIYIYIL